MGYVNDYMTNMSNIMNDIKRDNISEIIKTLETKNLLTDEVSTVLNEMYTSVKGNKKIKKEKKKRFSGYHLFMKIHREVVKKEQPDIKPQELTTIVSKAWTKLSKEEQEKHNELALIEKEKYYNSVNTTDDVTTDNVEPDSSAEQELEPENVSNKQDKQKEEPVKKSKKNTKSKTTTKKNVTSSDNDIPEAEPDIDL